MSKAILVTGATGKQGGAVVRALITANADVEILAVTRNPTGAGAQKLIQQSSNVKLVKGDLEEVASLFREATKVASQPIWGVFSVQANVASNSKGATTIRTQFIDGIDKKLDPEETSGMNLIDEAINHKVKYFVYTSVDRHGDKSITNPTPVPHFISKHNIEKYLMEAAKNADMDYTILRPTAFMDNMLGTFGKMFGTLWNTRPKDMKLQLVATSDIGHFGAQAFLNPESNIFKNQAISLAGDEISWEEAQQQFREVAGYAFPTTFSIFGHLLLFAVADVRLMFQWFVDEGYNADVEKLKTQHPGLKNFKTWIKEESGFVKV